MDLANFLAVLNSSTSKCVAATCIIEHDSLDLIRTFSLGHLEAWSQ